MSKKRTNKQYAQILWEATKDVKGKDLEEVLKNFVLLLVKEQKFKQSDKIISEFIAYAKKQAGIVEIEVTTATDINKNTLNEIRKVFGGKVEANNKVDKDILGGVIVKTEDKILDGSLKTQLRNLKNKLA